MGFIDNSGDVILDAVLTDAGRKKLAKGDGTFKITQFGLQDDEIDYGLFNSEHPSGSAYYDLEILRTPIFEAFTNNAASMKSKLISIPRTNLMYLPVLKLNNLISPLRNIETGSIADERYFVAVDEDTQASVASDFFAIDGVHGANGLIYGATLIGGAQVRVEQGLDTEEIPPTRDIDADLKETAYIVEMDNRLGQIVQYADDKATAGVTAKVSYIDDDNMASYYLTLGDPNFVKNNTDRTSTGSTQVIAGPRGTFLVFSVQASDALLTSEYYFSRFGYEKVINGTTYLAIKSNVRVVGATTGSSIVVPLTYLKNPS